jgi:hypothetical protein
MADYLPKPDIEFDAKASQIITALENDEAAYGILPADTLGLRAKLTAFHTALDASTAARTAATTAVANKDARRNDLETALRPLVQRIQVTPAVTDALRLQAGIPVRDTTRTVSAPISPVDLVVTADGAGTNRLKWSANGNTSGIQYVVEGKIGVAADYSTVDVVSGTTYNHLARVVGQAVNYRVRARRGTVLSEPSNVAGVHV